jgi:hypothetical protein
MRVFVKLIGLDIRTEFKEQEESAVHELGVQRFGLCGHEEENSVAAPGSRGLADSAAGRQCLPCEGLLFCLSPSFLSAGQMTDTVLAAYAYP